MAAHDTIVIGAGLAGLTAAQHLGDAGVDVVVVEARGRVGGRTFDADVSATAGARIELGAQWVGPTQHRVHRLIGQLGLETFPTAMEGENLLELPRRIVRYEGMVPRANPVLLADVQQALARFDRLCRQVPLEAPWSARKAGEWDAMTVESWLRRVCKTGLAREVFTMLIQAVWAAEPGELSLLHALFYAHAAGGLDPLFAVRGGAQQDRIVGGAQRLSTGLAERLDARVTLGAPVRRIRWRDDAVEVDADGGATLHARRAVLALPPALAGRIVYDPPLPAARDQLTQRVPMGSVVKCFALYDEPFWRDDGLSGHATSVLGPARVVFDNTPHEGRPGVLLAFLEGRAAREWGARTPAERRGAILDVLTRLFGPRAANPSDYLDRDWSNEPFTRGCYAGYFPPGVWTSYGRALRGPVGPLHWAGTETATVWPGYLDGAIQSGDRAAREVLAALGRARGRAA